ncbi:hypothetical protein HWV62_22656 [Athelia sp. TMB]|nr:hypothetical protein HWV62_22656 [Athelia sp. TMB]
MISLNAQCGGDVGDGQSEEEEARTGARRGGPFFSTTSYVQEPRAEQQSDSVIKCQRDSAKVDFSLRSAFWTPVEDDEGNDTVSSTDANPNTSYRERRSPSSSSSSDNTVNLKEEPLTSPETSLVFNQPPPLLESPPPKPAPLPKPPAPPRRSVMSREIPTFRGDGLATDPDPQAFFDQCEAMWMEAEPQWEWARQLRWFTLKLERSSEAKEWLTNLTPQPTTVDELRTAFDVRFPPKPIVTKTVVDKFERLEAHVQSLTEQNMLTTDERGTPNYLNWAAKVDAMAKGITDTDGLLAMQLWDKAPESLRTVVVTVTSFSNLVSQVQAIPKKRLEAAVAATAKLDRITMLAEGAAQARAAPETPTRGATAALANMTFGAARSQIPMPALLQPPANAANAPVPRAQGGYTAFGGRRAQGQYTDADRALRSRDEQTRHADFTRTKLPRPATQEAYRAQVAEFERLHRGLWPTEQRPFPVSPGTLDAGSNECYDCGFMHRREEAHLGPILDPREVDYRRMAGVVTRHTRRQGGARGVAQAAGMGNVNWVALAAFVNTMATQGGPQEDGEIEARIEEVVDQGNGGGASE